MFSGSWSQTVLWILVKKSTLDLWSKKVHWILVLKNVPWSKEMWKMVLISKIIIIFAEIIDISISG